MNTENKMHGNVITDLQAWQDNEKDIREDVREQKHFLKDKNGQWEQRIWDKKKDSPRYTFDKCNHIVDLICGPIEESTFGLKTSPANMNGDDSFCEVLNGILRGIEKDSGAQDIYNRSMRNCVESGFDAWIASTEYKPGAFNQQFKIKHISGAVDRVWIEPGSVEPDSSDAKRAVLLTFIPWDSFNNKYKDAENKKFEDVKTTIDDGKQWSRYWYKPEGVNVGTYFWCEKKPVEIALLSDGSVIEMKETTAETLELNGKVIMKQRADLKEVWYSQDFTQKEWLGEKRELAFKSNPIVTLYGNFDVIENKRIYSGAIQKLMDAQRVLNYAKSKEIEEGALAPRTKIWMAIKQAASNKVKNQLAKMNNSPDPVQFYDHVDGIPMPGQAGVNNVNPHLTNLSAQMQADIEGSAGKWAAQLGKNPMNQSGVALQSQIDQAELSDTKWGLILERAIKRTFDLIIEAMPTVMDVQDSIMSIDEAGNSKMVDINKPELVDGRVEMLNKVTSDYNIDVTIGPAYGSAQKQANAALLELAAVKPEVLQRNGDLFMNNISAPGMDLAVERERKALLQAGAIPESQMTEEEKQQMAMAAQAAQQPDPAMLLAQAENKKADAELMSAQLDQEKVMTDRINAETKRLEAMIKAQEAGVNMENTQADTAKKLSEIDKNQTDTVSKQIDNIQKTIGQTTAFR